MFAFFVLFYVTFVEEVLEAKAYIIYQIFTYINEEELNGSSTVRKKVERERRVRK